MLLVLSILSIDPDPTLIEQTFAIYQNLKMLEFLRLLDILGETNLLQREAFMP